MEEKDRIIKVNVEDILPNRFQPRLAFDEKELMELSNSIRKYGVIQPIVLRKIGDKYEIIAGERRYKATVLAGIKTIPAIINQTDDNTSAEIALLENLQRKNLTVIEEAQSFKKLLDRGFTQEEIATKLGISQSSIANKIRLLNLPKKIQNSLLYNKISERHARSLLSLGDPETQIQLLDRIINEKLTVKQTEDEISRILNKNIKVDETGKEEVEDDIPDEIRKYITPKPENMEIGTNQFIKSVPEVLNIEMEEPKENTDEQENEKEKEERENINPFQIQFKDGLRKIEEEVKNQQDSYYDRIISDDLRNNDYKNKMVKEFEEQPEEHKEEPKENKHEENVVKNVSNTVTKVREFVKNIEDENIKTSEVDLPDKYQIIIEIKK